MAKQRREGRPLQVYLDDATWTALERLARRMGRSMSDEARAAFRRHLANPPSVLEPPLGEDSEPNAVRPAVQPSPDPPARRARQERQPARSVQVASQDDDVRVVPLED